MNSFWGLAATACRTAARAVSSSKPAIFTPSFWDDSKMLQVMPASKTPAIPTDWWTKLYASKGPTSSWDKFSCSSEFYYMPDSANHQQQRLKPSKSKSMPSQKSFNIGFVWVGFSAGSHSYQVQPLRSRHHWKYVALHHLKSSAQSWELKKGSIPFTLVTKLSFTWLIVRYPNNKNSQSDFWGHNKLLLLRLRYSGYQFHTTEVAMQVANSELPASVHLAGQLMLQLLKEQLAMAFFWLFVSAVDTTQIGQWQLPDSESGALSDAWKKKGCQGLERGVS